MHFTKLYFRILMFYFLKIILLKILETSISFELIQFADFALKAKAQRISYISNYQLVFFP
jgi:hypothetical protein